ncbi:unnamed protein product [Camellia sinensis]
MSGAGAPDFFYREAQRLGYVARSAFKRAAASDAEAIQTHQTRFFHSRPWLCSWCLASGSLSELGPIKKWWCSCGHRPQEQKVKVPSLHCDARVRTVCADVMNLPKCQVKALSPQQLGFSVILSDMCPLVSGITTKDAALSAELGMRALDLAVGGTAILDDIIQRERQSDGSDSSPDDRGVLKRGGHLIIKFLESEDVQEFSRICKPLFRKASWLRPKATRSSSREIYLICQV